MKNRKKVINSLEELLKLIYENAPDDKKTELDELKEKLEQIKVNEEKLKDNKDIKK